MHIKLYLYPSYVTIESAREHSPNFFRFLDGQSVDCEVQTWNGDELTLPSEPALIRWSTTFSPSQERFVLDVCSRYKHLLFYDDSLVLPSGMPSVRGQPLIEAAKEFLMQFS